MILHLELCFRQHRLWLSLASWFSGCKKLPPDALSNSIFGLSPALMHGTHFAQFLQLPCPLLRHRTALFTVLLTHRTCVVEAPLPPTGAAASCPPMP